MHLICLPYAGGDSKVFRNWSAFLSPQIKVCSPCLPGRDERVEEKTVSKMDDLVRDLACHLLPLVDGPYALFGHSMGAFIAFELARAFRRLRKPEPLHLFVAAQRAPKLPYPLVPIYDRNDDEFLSGIKQRYGETVAPALLTDPGMRTLLLAQLHADFSVVETYLYRSEPRLSCSLTALGGCKDSNISISDLEPWGFETGGRFSVETLAGGHFFLRTERMPLLSLINKTLAPFLV